MSTADQPLAVEVRGVSKSFGGVLALDHVSVDLREGEVHALLGENGAGKTTLSNILAGLYREDSGSVVVGGVERHFHSPAQAIEAGIGMVHQHFRLVASMTVAENLHLGSPDTPTVVSGRALVHSARRMMDEIGLSVDPTAKIWQLSVGEQQRVEILRVLARGAKVLILDEPTAVLTGQEARELFGVMRGLVAGGRTVVFISHKLNEVLEVSDRITVLRGGRHVTTRDAEGATARELARLMTGEEMGIEVEHREVVGDPVLEVRGVSVRNSRGVQALHEVELSVRAGEIMGIAGVSGNGQTELAEVITGMRACQSGSITIDGSEVANATTRVVADLGVGHIPEDRIGVGMVASAPVKDNAVLRHYRTAELSSRRMLRRDRVVQFAKDIVDAGRVQTRSVHTPAGQMSGGNQQRLVARRESLVADRLLVAAHPTRGLDVLAAKQVQSAIVERRDAGCAVVMISDDLDEIMMIADRIAVMYEGRVMGVFDRAGFDRERIGLLMGGQTVGADG
jgi:general nucleoside transport system ATP-binding protein